ncbi:baculoviral IAP repeat-containing protein 7-B-like [Argopecten irradians]|uniref:baculoviral IAP repeat-containing protein 7-B-like n=1 Tax=Argopecten irradians TaxID=31199 RepID=UPI00371A1C75
MATSPPPLQMVPTGAGFNVNDLSHTLSRLLSFQNFPAEHYTIFLTKLVNSGLYYTSIGDLVCCFYCGVKLHVADLTELSNVNDIHRNLSPGCGHVSDVNVTSTLAFPKFLIGKNRLGSLRKSGIPEDFAMDLAKNGFFFDGERDKIRCFHCGKKFKLNRRNGLVLLYQEHTRKSPNCSFIKQKPVHSSIEWALDTAHETFNSEIRPPSSADILLEKAECRSRLMCAICKKNEKSVTFLPCQHSCLCKECQYQMQPKFCLICKKAINDTFQYKLTSL